MANVNQTGIAISIKAFLPFGKDIDSHFQALSLLKAAHESGDYSEVLKVASIDAVKAEQKTRRVTVAEAVNVEVQPESVETPAPTATETEDASGLAAAFDAVETDVEEESDADGVVEDDAEFTPPSFLTSK